ncbi:uncharacterized protein [Musca autumnalis]|uniref:uncharacterized protein n=1 Tax=Musca autumnalis TaxID=221902 RepID=UPI003CFA07B8
MAFTMNQMNQKYNITWKEFHHTGTYFRLGDTTAEIQINDRNGMAVSKNNVFIFNWVEDYNYNGQIAKLEKAFESGQLNNRVCVFHHLSSREIQLQVQKLRKLDFGLFRYVVVVILDNKSTNDMFIRTSDNENILLNTELLTMFKTNPTLDKKPRLFVIQKLADYSVEDDGEVAKRYNYVTSQDWYKNLKLETLYEGLEFSIEAKERTGDFSKSNFIDAFCKEFVNSNNTPIPQIVSNIRKKSSIEFGTNQTLNDDGILGTAVEPDDLRDYF